jgi:hypothetical protein
MTLEQAKVGSPDRLLLIVLGLSLLANVGQYVLRLRTQPAVSPYTVNRYEKNLLPQPGTTLASLHLLSADGSKAELQFGSNELPTVVYVMSPTCKWCERNLQMIDALVTQVHGRYRVIGISNTTKGLQDYIHKISPPFPIYYPDPNYTNAAITTDITPRTLLFSPSGSFIQGWNRAYLNQTKSDIAMFFKISLPDEK